MYRQRRRARVINDQILEQVIKLIQSSNFIVAVTGAGVSAESGVPTFRGKDGLWKQYDATQLATPHAFKRNPKLVWEWYSWRINLIREAKPNPAHICLSKLESNGLLRAIITQNVDNLHQKAGSKNVLELHGNIFRVKCTSCNYKAKIEKAPDQIPPLCPKCNSLLRPDVVWFGEFLDVEILHNAYSLASKADLMLVIGSSLLVSPAAELPNITLKHGGKVIEINLDETYLSPVATVSIRTKAGEFFKALCEKLKL